MPDGKLHEVYRKKGRVVILPLSILLPIIISPIPMRYFGEWYIGIGIITGYEFGKYLNPDADIMGTTTGEGYMVNELPVVGHFLFGITSTYGSIFRKHHRSFITHFPFVSTLIRYLFVFWWFWLEIYKSEKNLAWIIFLFIGAYIGTSISDSIHAWLDFIKFKGSE